MSFTPFARYRNFTLANLKALLEVYPDMARNIPWEEAKNFSEAKLKGYKRTAYQQACQFGLEDRSKDSFRIHNYLYTFDDENLAKYLVFWFKTYFAPNPHVKSPDEPFLLYCRLCEDILQSESHSVNFEDFVEKNIGGKSDDILLNAIKAYAAPVKYSKVGNGDNLYISESDVNAIEEEVNFIKTNFPIGDPKSEHDFFERFSYANFCKFYGENENPSVKDGEEIRLADTSRVELPFIQSKECAHQLVDCVYRIDNFERFSGVLKNNDKNVKIITDDLGGNYLRYMFAKSTSDLYENTSGGKTRVFLDKDYEFKVDGVKEKCRLSTEWVSSELGSGTASANYLKALIEIINAYYSDVLKIYEEFGIWYLEYLKQDFKLSDLPKCFKSKFAKRYIQSLLAKPFVILTGNSGTGKTRISKQFAEYLEVDFGNDEKNWVLVPVGADWTDNTKIIGYYNPLANDGNGKYEKTVILKLIERANLPENRNVPFFIILDEMNLSHVERYFADFLSHMETPDLKFALDGYPGVVRYPENLFVVGTVNIDETTYMFSPNIIEVIRDNINKQKCLKVMKCILLVIFICAVSIIGLTIYRLKKPQNFISPLAEDSIEMQTAELLSGPDGAFVYKFITTDKYKKLRLHIYRYKSGKLSDQDKVEMGFEDSRSPKSGEIVMVPDFDNYVIKLIISGDGSKLSTEIPILEKVEDREYYGRTATEIKNVVDIKYNEQQPLIAFVYDNDEMSVPTLDDLINSQTDFLSKNDYVYYVAFEFCK